MRRHARGVLGALARRDAAAGADEEGQVRGRGDEVCEGVEKCVE